MCKRTKLCFGITHQFICHIYRHKLRNIKRPMKAIKIIHKTLCESLDTIICKHGIINRYSCCSTFPTTNNDSKVYAIQANLAFSSSPPPP